MTGAPRALSAAVVIAFAVCACDTPTGPAPFAPVGGSNLVSVGVQGSGATVGTASPFTATATFSDGRTQDVTAAATWKTSNPSVATASSSGVVTGVRAGAADIQATFQGVAGRQGVIISGLGDYLAYVSDTGEPIGAGTVGVDRTFLNMIDRRSDPSGQRLSFLGRIEETPTTFFSSWTLELQAPPGRDILNAVFENAAGYPGQPAGSPGMRFTVFGRTCAQYAGRFAIDDTRINNLGIAVRAHITFEQRCAGDPRVLRGEISFRR